MRKSPGMSLIELIVSLAVLVVAVLVLSSVFPTQQRGAQQSSNRTNAAFLAQSLLERARSRPFATLASDPPGFTTVVLNGQDNGARANQILSYRTDVVAIQPGLDDVYATVTWHDSTGDKTLVLETNVAQLYW